MRIVSFYKNEISSRFIHAWCRRGGLCVLKVMTNVLACRSILQNRNLMLAFEQERLKVSKLKNELSMQTSLPENFFRNAEYEEVNWLFMKFISIDLYRKLNVVNPRNNGNIARMSDVRNPGSWEVYNWATVTAGAVKSLRFYNTENPFNARNTS